MSLETREKVANHPNVIVTDEQRADLLDPAKTNTYLIALLEYLCITKSNIVQFTAIHSDHHDDSSLNPDDPRHTGTHQGGIEYDGTPTGGWAADFWFLRSHTNGDWLDQNSPAFAHALAELAAAPYLLQIGLAGSAVTDANLAASGPTVFIDEGDDHIHVGTA